MPEEKIKILKSVSDIMAFCLLSFPSAGIEEFSQVERTTISNLGEPCWRPREDISGPGVWEPFSDLDPGFSSSSPCPS